MFWVLCVICHSPGLSLAPVPYPSFARPAPQLTDGLWLVVSQHMWLACWWLVCSWLLLAGRLADKWIAGVLEADRVPADSVVAWLAAGWL